MATYVIFRTPTKVLSVDFHPTKPWILGSLESGTVDIWDYKSKTPVNTLQVTDSPVRTAKFIERQKWIVCGSDDRHIYVYNYSSWEKYKQFPAHGDFIRCLAVHTKSPWLLSASDDMLIKKWDWEKNWACRVFEGHSDRVMYTAFSPTEKKKIASASMDCTVKIWNIDSPDPIFSWVAHRKGINCVNYYMGDCEKHHLITGSDDFTAKVWEWDGKTAKVVATLERHTGKVTAACKHPELPYLITASEDGTVRLWDASTYEPVKPLKFNLGGVWGIACKKDYEGAAFGCDKGVVIVFDLENPEASASA